MSFWRYKAFCKLTKLNSIASFGAFRNTVVRRLLDFDIKFQMGKDAQDSRNIFYFEILHIEREELVKCYIFKGCEVRYVF